MIQKPEPRLWKFGAQNETQILSLYATPSKHIQTSYVMFNKIHKSFR